MNLFEIILSIVKVFIGQHPDLNKKQANQFMNPKNNDTGFEIFCQTICDTMQSNNVNIDVYDINSLIKFVINKCRFSILSNITSDQIKQVSAQLPKPLMQRLSKNLNIITLEPKDYIIIVFGCPDNSGTDIDTVVFISKNVCTERGIIFSNNRNNLHLIKLAGLNLIESANSNSSANTKPEKQIDINYCLYDTSDINTPYGFSKGDTINTANIVLHTMEYHNNDADAIHFAKNLLTKQPMEYNINALSIILFYLKTCAISSYVKILVMIDMTKN